MTDDDLKMIRVLIHAIDNNGSFSLKAREAAPFAMAYNWLKKLQVETEANLKANKIKIKEETNGDQ